MKAFIISITVFVALAVLVCASSAYFCDHGQRLLESASALPVTLDGENFERVFDGLTREWNAVRSPIRFLVGNTECELIEDATDGVAQFFRAGDRANYLRARMQLIRSIERLIATEAFSLDSII